MEYHLKKVMRFKIFCYIVTHQMKGGKSKHGFPSNFVQV